MCHAYTLIGKIMLPTLCVGDLALIDQERAEWSESEVFALIDMDGALRLKRIRIVAKKRLILVSGNAKDHPSEPRFEAEANRIRPLGRIVWLGHRWK